MKTWRKRMSAWLVALVMVVSLLPAAAAETAYTVSVTPETQTVNVGDTITFTATVTGDGTKLESFSLHPSKMAQRLLP